MVYGISLLDISAIKRCYIDLTTISLINLFVISISELWNSIWERRLETNYVFSKNKSYFQTFFTHFSIGLSKNEKKNTNYDFESITYKIWKSQWFYIKKIWNWLIYSQINEKIDVKHVKCLIDIDQFINYTHLIYRRFNERIKYKTNFNIDTLLYLKQKTRILPNIYIQKCFFLEYQL